MTQLHPARPQPRPVAGRRTSTAASFDHGSTSSRSPSFPWPPRAQRGELPRPQAGTQARPVAVVEVSSTSHEVHRTPALIAQSNQRYFKLNLQLQGTGPLIQDNREALLRPGDLSIYAPAGPTRLRFEGERPAHGGDVPVGRAVPASGLHRAAFGRADGCSTGGLAAIVGPFIAHLAENLDALSGPSGSRLATNALDLVSTMLHSELDMSPDRMKPQALLAASVREYIDAHLADPLLSPASIAAAHFIPPGTFTTCS